MPLIEPLYAFAIFVMITSIGQTLFATILLLLPKRGQLVANRFLAAFMLCMCAALCLFLLFDFWRVYLPHTTLIYQPLILLMPPLLWFYLISMTSTEAVIKLKDILLHSVPAVLICVSLIPFYQLSGIDKIEWVYMAKDNYIQMSDVQVWTKKLLTPIHIVTILQGVTYGVFSYMRIKQHQTRISNEFSFTHNIDLRWLIYQLASCMLIYLYVAVVLLLDLLSVNASLLWVTSFCVGCTLLSIFGYFGVRQEAIFVKQINSGNERPQKELVAVTFSSEGIEQKYKSSALSEENVEECYAELLSFMTLNKPYTDPELSLKGLAEQLQLPARELSRIINEKSNKNFMEFVNRYRISEAKSLLRNSTPLKIIDISMMAGFHSKSSFYEAFKKFTGITPALYKQKHVVTE